MKNKVLVVGELNVDLILNNIEGIPEIGAEKLAEDMILTLGSSSAIFASNLSFQKVDVSFLGMIGEDQFGQLVISTFKDKNVKTDLIIESTEHQTGVTVVMNYGLDRAMATYQGAMSHLSFEHFDKINLADFDHIHVSSIFLQPLIKESICKIFSKAKEHNLSTSLDPQWDPNEKWDLPLENLLPLVDVFLPNEKELFALTKTDSVTKGIEKLEPFSKGLVIKKGENGACLKMGEELLSISAFLNDNVVDAIGAGDSFDAGFIYGYINKFTNLDSLERASILGAISTTNAGGTSAFSNHQAVEKIAREKFKYTFKI